MLKPISKPTFTRSYETDLHVLGTFSAYANGEGPPYALVGFEVDGVFSAAYVILAPDKIRVVAGGRRYETPPELVDFYTASEAVAYAEGFWDEPAFWAPFVRI